MNPLELIASFTSKIADAAQTIKGERDKRQEVIVRLRQDLESAKSHRAPLSDVDARIPILVEHAGSEWLKKHGYSLLYHDAEHAGYGALAAPFEAKSFQVPLGLEADTFGFIAASNPDLAI